MFIKHFMKLIVLRLEETIFLYLNIYISYSFSIMLYHILYISSQNFKNLLDFWYIYIVQDVTIIAITFFNLIYIENKIKVKVFIILLLTFFLFFLKKNKKNRYIYIPYNYIRS